MKRHYTSRSKVLFLLLAVAGAVEAQTHEFAPVGAEWHYGRQTMFTWGYIRIFVTNDTIIDGHVCSVLQKEEHGFNYYSQALYHFNIGREYFTQIKDSVLVYRKGRFYKLFDFGAEIGDSWTIPGEEEDGHVIVCGKGIEIVDGNELRYILIADEFGSPYGYGNEMAGDTLFLPDTIKVLERIGPVGSYLLPEQKTHFDDSEGGELRCYSDSIIDINYSYPLVHCDYINDNNIGFDENVQISDYGIYPNPATTWVAVDYTLPGGASKATLAVTNALGITVMSTELDGSTGQKVLDLRPLANGVYTCTVLCGKYQMTGKLVIAK